MTLDEIIHVAQELVRRQSPGLGPVVGVIDLEAHLRDCERKSGHAVEERMRAMARGKFVVHFEIPHGDDEVVSPEVAIVEVDTSDGSARFVLVL